MYVSTYFKITMYYEHIKMVFFGVGSIRPFFKEAWNQDLHEKELKKMGKSL